MRGTLASCAAHFGPRSQRNDRHSRFLVLSAPIRAGKSTVAAGNYEMGLPSSSVGAEWDAEAVPAPLLMRRQRGL